MARKRSIYLLDLAFNRSIPSHLHLQLHLQVKQLHQSRCTSLPPSSPRLWLPLLLSTALPLPSSQLLLDRSLSQLPSRLLPEAPLMVACASLTATVRHPAPRLSTRATLTISIAKTCQEGKETGEKDAMFILENGAKIKNVILGPGQAEGIHCKGTWFVSLPSSAPSSSVLRYI